VCFLLNICCWLPLLSVVVVVVCLCVLVLLLCSIIVAILGPCPKSQSPTNIIKNDITSQILNKYYTYISAVLDFRVFTGCLSGQFMISKGTVPSINRNFWLWIFMHLVFSSCSSSLRRTSYRAFERAIDYRFSSKPQKFSHFMSSFTGAESAETSAPLQGSTQDTSERAATVQNMHAVLSRIEQVSNVRTLHFSFCRAQ